MCVSHNIQCQCRFGLEIRRGSQKVYDRKEIHRRYKLRDY